MKEKASAPASWGCINRPLPSPHHRPTSPGSGSPADLLPSQSLGRGKRWPVADLPGESGVKAPLPPSELPPEKKKEKKNNSGGFAQCEALASPVGDRIAWAGHCLAGARVLGAAVSRARSPGPRARRCPEGQRPPRHLSEVPWLPGCSGRGVRWCGQNRWAPVPRCPARASWPGRGAGVLSPCPSGASLPPALSQGSRSPPPLGKQLPRPPYPSLCGAGALTLNLRFSQRKLHFHLVIFILAALGLSCRSQDLS